MPIFAKVPLYGGLFIVETAIARFADWGGEFIVRNCCPKLVDREQE
jgi:hypothetical protein